MSEALNQGWSVDFMHDARVCGRRFRMLNVVDDFNCEALSIEKRSESASSACGPCARQGCGYPVMLRIDHGPEFISLTLPEWAEKHAVKL